MVSFEDAMQRATVAQMDLVEVSPNAAPPVCKIIDYGKLKYQEQKKKNEARKKQKKITSELEKEVNAYSPDGATSDMMQKIEEGERKLAEISAKELDSYNKLKGLFRDHDLASTLAFHGVTQADIEKKATATGGPIDTAISRISPAAKAKIAEIGRAHV